MEMVKITTRLGRMALRYDYTIVCDDLKSAIVEHGKKDDGTEYSKWGVELTNPVEYTREQILSKYDSNAILIKWVDTFTETGEPAMAVVFFDKNKAGK